MKTENVILIIADISGYTRFMLEHQKALIHSQMIISALLNLLVQQAEPPLEVVELEGDAVFMFALPAGRDSSTKSIGEQLLKFFKIFKQKAGELQAYSMCLCNACTNISNLKLKIVVHSGEAVFNKIGRFNRLSGVDVITVHRLLKNSVAADEYILATESAISELNFPEKFAMTAMEEVYDVGPIKTYVGLPEAGNAAFTPKIAAQDFSTSNVGLEILRYEIRREYTEVAETPQKGFHFHTGSALAEMLEYDPQWYAAIPAEAAASFAGTGNPFSVGTIRRGDYIVDVGSGAGFDSLIAAHFTGPTGRVVGVEMTPAMLNKARVASTGLSHVEFREGLAESLPLPGEWADLVISNGVINLCPDKPAVFREMHRVLKPGGRLQIGDIVVQKAVSEEAKRNIDLCTG